MRQPLTKKRRCAIEEYAVARCKGLHIVYLLIEYTLKAERMPANELYAWLEKRGYRWRKTYWQSPKKESKAG